MTSVPFLMTLKQELMICHVALYCPLPPPCPVAGAPRSHLSPLPGVGICACALMDGELKDVILRGTPCRLRSLVGVMGVVGVCMEPDIDAE